MQQKLNSGEVHISITNKKINIHIAKIGEMISLLYKPRRTRPTQVIRKSQKSDMTVSKTKA